MDIFALKIFGIVIVIVVITLQFYFIIKLISKNKKTKKYLSKKENEIKYGLLGFNSNGDLIYPKTAIRVKQGEILYFDNKDNIGMNMYSEILKKDEDIFDYLSLENCSSYKRVSKNYILFEGSNEYSPKIIVKKDIGAITFSREVKY